MAKIVDTHWDHVGDPIPELDGLSIRQALKALRQFRAGFGNIGGVSCRLSDGTYLTVGLRRAYGGGQLMCSQRINRLDKAHDRIIRTYPWAQK